MKETAEYTRAVKWSLIGLVVGIAVGGNGAVMVVVVTVVAALIGT